MSIRRTPGWPSGYIEGVGQVPGGPLVVQIASGSVAVVPPMASSPRYPSSDVVIKTEPIGETFLQSIEEAEQPAVNELPEEEYLGPADLVDVQEFGTFNANDFAHQFNIYNQQSRTSRNRSSYYSRDSEGDTAVRQRIDSSVRLRSRSPMRFSDRSSSGLASDRSSPLFLPEDNRSRGSASIESAIRRNTSLVNLNDSAPSDPNIKKEEIERCSECRCPISYACPERAVHHLDCRFLVREWEGFGYRTDQEAFDRIRAAGSFGERFTNAQKLASIVLILDNFDIAPNAQRRARAMDQMQSWILDMEDVTIRAGPEQQTVTQHVLPRLKNFLGPINQQIRQTGGLPDFIEEELTVLDNKWGKGDFDGSIHRGLDERETLDVNGNRKQGTFSVNEAWQQRFGADAKNFGHNGSVNGQIWLKRVEMMRDGMHALTIGGISGNPRTGAYSVVLGAVDKKNNKAYANIDMGNVIEYMGTALPDEGNSGPTNEVDAHMYNPASWQSGQNCEDATSATRALARSQETGRPVRVIRSWKMHDSVQNKPRKGYRYDGLYEVVRRSALKEARQIWSFRLERLPGQGRLRGFEPHNQHPPSNGRRPAHAYF